jgi:predicted MFS family arabinose efflux permease
MTAATIDRRSRYSPGKERPSDMERAARTAMYRYLIVLTIASTVGLQSWRTLFNNFAVDVARLNGQQVGIIQSLRELPGFLTLLVVFVIRIVAEHRLSSLSVLLLGLGVAITGFFPSYPGLAMTTVLMSFGFHYYETTNQSLTLQYFDRETAPWVFGKQRSYAAASNVGIGLAIWGMDRWFGYVDTYLCIGGLIACVALWGATQNPTHTDTVVQHKKMIFRWKYWLFYFLTFMAGARRQIFATFAVFLLVVKFNYSVGDITLLFVLNNIINYFVTPWLGRGIIRYGECKMLSLEYASLIAIFVTYAFTGSRLVVAVLYVFDQILFNFSIAIRTYFQKVGDPRDIAPSMAVGFTINHIAAVVLPALGGAIWLIDYRWVFLGGAAMSLISLTAVQCIRLPGSVPATTGTAKGR